MTTSKKEQKLHVIAKIYLTLFLGKFSNSQISLFRRSVEHAYESLNAPLKKIINNDFFYQDYPGWWELLYKKNDYLKLKKEAVSSFLEAYYAL